MCCTQSGAAARPSIAAAVVRTRQAAVLLVSVIRSTPPSRQGVEPAQSGADGSRRHRVEPQSVLTQSIDSWQLPAALVHSAPPGSAHPASAPRPGPLEASTASPTDSESGGRRRRHRVATHRVRALRGRAAAHAERARREQHERAARAPSWRARLAVATRVLGPIQSQSENSKSSKNARSCSCF